MTDQRALYQAVADGTLADLLAAQPGYVSDEVADQCGADFEDAAAAGAYGPAWAVATARAFVLLHLGHRAKSLSARLDAEQARFMAADQPQEYAAARSAALGIGAHALELPTDEAAPVLLKAWVLAADCSWFAAGDEQTGTPALLQAVGDTTDALTQAGRTSPEQVRPMWVLRLASLTAAVARHAGILPIWPDQLQLPARAALRRLAAASEHLPLELPFPGPDGPQRAAEVAAALAELEATLADAPGSP